MQNNILKEATNKVKVCKRLYQYLIKQKSIKSSQKKSSNPSCSDSWETIAKNLTKQGYTDQQKALIISQIHIPHAEKLTGQQCNLTYVLNNSVYRQLGLIMPGLTQVHHTWCIWMK